MPPQKSSFQVREVERRINKQLRKFSEQQAVVIPEPAKQIIRSSLLAITIDPSPLWRRDMDKFKFVQRDMIERLPSLLSEVASASPFRKIDTFTLLHLMSGILERVCPFDKPR
jgi:hypothetical protein